MSSAHRRCKPGLVTLAAKLFAAPYWSRWWAILRAETSGAATTRSVTLEDPLGPLYAAASIAIDELIVRVMLGFGSMTIPATILERTRSKARWGDISRKRKRGKNTYVGYGSQRNLHR